MAWSSETAMYSGWKETYVKNSKGKSEIHYYLERKERGVDLAVIGRFKSSSNNNNRVSFRYALKKNRCLLKKLNCREDVVDWLDSIVSGVAPHVADKPATKANGGLNIVTLMNGEFQKPIHQTINFSWMGSSWTCKKRRKHYQSFLRNGVKVSVNDFVYVLAEQNRRLIAYLEDLYEDSKGNKMVAVQWFHKTDEVGIDLTDDVNEREIFFSLSLQDINIECIDGLATVLSPQHYEKFLKVPIEIQRIAFFCEKLYGDDAIKPYDITQLEGYWRQEMLRYLNVSVSKSGEGAQAPGASLVGCGGIRSRKRSRPSASEISGSPSADDLKVDCRASSDSIKLGSSDASGANDGSSSFIRKGSFVEVLSEDSGIRGCWFKALIMKKHKDKVKVQYLDIQDADDESKKLEEWILTSRVATADHLGVRIPGRKIVRPVQKLSEENDVLTVGAGTPVDLWWCDGWWEGIVVQKVSEEKFEVYLPGEKKLSTFLRCDLRPSLEWSADEWVNMENLVGSVLTDLVSSVLTLKEKDAVLVNSVLSSKEKEVEVKHDEKPSEVGAGNDVISLKDVAKLTFSRPCPRPRTNKASTKRPVPDLLKDVLGSDLKWKASKKRNRTVSCCSHNPSKAGVFSSEGSFDCENCKYMGNSLFGSSWKRIRIVSCCPHDPTLTDGFSKKKSSDCENCKFAGDSLFGSSVRQPLTGLVMLR